MGETYPMPAHGWTCYFCGETLTTPGGAADHFGADMGEKPACVMFDEIGTRGVVRALRKSQNRAWRFQQKAESLEYMLRVDRENWSEITGLKRAHDARFELDCLEGRALTAEAIVADIERRWPALVDSARRRVCAVPLQEHSPVGQGTGDAD